MEGYFPEEIKCPICFELPTKEIFQCKNGHTVCSNCANSLSQCPQCRVPLEQTKIRNRALESLLDSMKFDCTNKTSGCTVKLTRSEFTDHIDRCNYRGATGNEPSAPPASPPPEKRLSVRRPPVPPPKPRVQTYSSSDTSSSPVDLSSLQKRLSLLGLSLPSSILFPPNVSMVNGGKSVAMVNGQTFVNEQLVQTDGNQSQFQQYSNLQPNIQGCVSSSGGNTITINGQSFINGQLIGAGGNQSRTLEQEDFKACRDKTLYFSSSKNAVVTGNGGFLVKSGSGTVTVNGSPQHVTKSGSGKMTIEGNVTEGVVISGSGNLTVSGYVRGGITKSGSGNINVEGDVYGDINVSGVGSVKINGRHYNGSVYQSGMGTVKFSGYN